LPNFVCAEGEIHDQSRLPHLYEEDEIEKQFPLISAAPAVQNSEDWTEGNDKMDAREEYEAPSIRRGGDRQRLKGGGYLPPSTSAAPDRRADPRRK